MGVVTFCYIYCRKDYSKGLTNHKVMHDRLGSPVGHFLSKYYPKNCLTQTKKRSASIYTGRPNTIRKIPLTYLVGGTSCLLYMLKYVSNYIYKFLFSLDNLND